MDFYDVGGDIRQTHASGKPVRDILLEIMHKLHEILSLQMVSHDRDIQFHKNYLVILAFYKLCCDSFTSAFLQVMVQNISVPI